MKRVALATRELEGLTPGGIGGIVAGLARQALADGLEVDLLVPEDATALSAPAVRRVLGERVTVLPVAPAPGPSRGAAHALARGFELAVATHWPRRGWVGVEFPDYGGWAGTLAPRHRVDPSLDGLRVVVRLHGPASVIHWLEGQHASHEALLVYDLERLTLRHADVVRAALAPVADEVAAFFRLGSPWRARLELGLPPLPLRRPGPAEAGVNPATRDLVFSTKLQPIKQPALFVRGAVRLMEAAAWWRGRACFAAHGAEGPALAELLAGVPAHLRPRFVALRPPERAAALRRGVVVVPSHFETLCLAAWEPALDGSAVVVNEACPAFAPGTPLRALPTVSAFDGTAASLALALEAALPRPAGAPLAAPAAAPSWWLEAPAVPLRQARPVARRRVLVLGKADAGQVEVARAAGFELEELSRSALTRLTGAEPREVRRCLLGAPGEIATVVRAGVALEASFLVEAARALERDDALALVSPAPAGEAPYLGEAPTLGLTENALAAPTSVFRTSLAEVLPEAGDWEHAFWVMALRAAATGAGLVSWWREGGPAGTPSRKALRNWVRHQASPLPSTIHPWALDFVRRAGWSGLLP